VQPDGIDGVGQRGLGIKHLQRRQQRHGPDGCEARAPRGKREHGREALGCRRQAAMVF